MKTNRIKQQTRVSLDKKCLAIVMLISTVVIVLYFKITDQSMQLNVNPVSDQTSAHVDLRETVAGVPPSAAVTSTTPTSTTSTIVETSSTSTSTTSTTSTTEGTSSSTTTTTTTTTTPKTDVSPVGKFFPTDFHDESYFEPYCAMQSNAHKYLIWPDTPTDFTDWTYKRIRKCPTLVIPENITFTKRVKYSLNCDNGKPKLLPSFTDRSDDLDVVTLNDSCLARFTNSCCNDTRGTPNIVHYVWYFTREMPFHFFLSMLSIVRYVRPCLILFHGEFLPYGKYWDYIIRIYPNILHAKRPRPLYIFGVKISAHEHSGDIMRMEALLRLGGIYLDDDVIVLRDLEVLRDYDITLCRQASGYMLNAFIMAKRNTTFMNLWMDGYRNDYRNDSYVYNSMQYNGDLAAKRPELIHIEDGTLCGPAPMINKPINDSMIYDWTALYGFHLYSRTIHVPWDVDWIKSFNYTFGSFVRQIVYGNKEVCD